MNNVSENEMQEVDEAVFNRLDHDDVCYIEIHEMKEYIKELRKQLRWQEKINKRLFGRLTTVENIIREKVLKF